MQRPINLFGKFGGNLVQERVQPVFHRPVSKTTGFKISRKQRLLQLLDELKDHRFDGIPRRHRLIVTMILHQSDGNVFNVPAHRNIILHKKEIKRPFRRSLVCVFVVSVQFSDCGFTPISVHRRDFRRCRRCVPARWKGGSTPATGRSCVDLRRSIANATYCPDEESNSWHRRRSPND